jgi:hypothetical protein
MCYSLSAVLFFLASYACRNLCSAENLRLLLISHCYKITQQQLVRHKPLLWSWIIFIRHRVWLRGETQSSSARLCKTDMFSESLQLDATQPDIHRCLTAVHNETACESLSSRLRLSIGLVTHTRDAENSTEVTNKRIHIKSFHKLCVLLKSRLKRAFCYTKIVYRTHTSLSSDSG